MNNKDSRERKNSPTQDQVSCRRRSLWFLLAQIIDIPCRLKYEVEDVPGVFQQHASHHIHWIWKCFGRLQCLINNKERDVRLVQRNRNWFRFCLKHPNPLCSLKSKVSFDLCSFHWGQPSLIFYLFFSSHKYQVSSSVRFIEDSRGVWRLPKHT